MKNMLLIAVGVWIGREIYLRLGENRSKEKELKIQQQLKQFIQEQLPTLSPSEVANHIKQILK